MEASFIALRQMAQAMESTTNGYSTSRKQGLEDQTPSSVGARGTVIRGVALRLLRQTLQGQCADEIGQPVDERLVEFQIKRRLAKLFSIAHEHATLAHQPDGGAHGILVRRALREKAPHERRGAGEKGRCACGHETTQRLAWADILPGKDADVTAHLVPGDKGLELLAQKAPQGFLARHVFQFLRVEIVQPQIALEGDLEHLEIESFLALEMVVDCRLIDARLGDDGPNARTVVAPLGEEGDGGLHEAVARILSWSGHNDMGIQTVV